MIIGRPGERAWGRGLLIALLLWTPLEVPAISIALQRVGHGWVQLAPPLGFIAAMAPITVLTWWAVERWPLAGHRARPRHYALHAPLLLSTSWVFVAAVQYPIGWAGGILDPLGDAFVFWLPSMVLAYGFNAGAAGIPPPRPIRSTAIP